MVGTVIGSGIFLVPKRMITEVGDRYHVHVWVVGGLLSLFGALTYAELAAAMPEAGGEYVFLREAYGPFWGYLYSWTQLVVAKSGSIATLGTGFYLYLSVFLPALNHSVVTIPYPIGPGGNPLEIHVGQLIAIGVIAVLCAINYVGVEAGGKFQVVVTALKMVLLAGVVVIGVFSTAGSLRALSPNRAGVGHGFSRIFRRAWWARSGPTTAGITSAWFRPKSSSRSATFPAH